MERIDLSMRICKAFESVPQPKKDEFTRGDSLEAAMIRNYFARSTWQDVNEKLFADYDSRADLSAVLGFLSHKGFKYLLPAVLIFLTKKGDQYGSFFDALLWKLAANDDVSSPRGFTEEMRLAIREWLMNAYESSIDDEFRQKDIESALQIWDRLGV